MATYLFKYNPSGTPESGATQIKTLQYSSGNVDVSTGGWYSGIDDTGVYVITCDTTTTGLAGRTTGGGTGVAPANIPTFWKTAGTSESQLLEVVNRLPGSPGNLTTTAGATGFLNSNNYGLFSTSPLLSNIVLYYDPSNSSSYSGTGTTINDISGNGINGTMSNISFTSPYFSYNGSSSQISVADNPSLEPGSGSWTMEVWVNQSVSGNDVVLGKFNNGGLAQNVSYSIRTTGTTFYAQLGSGSGSGSTLFVNSTNHVGTLNTWYQLVYVFKNGATKTLETFVNGSSIGTVNHSLASLLNSTNPLYLGSYNGGEYAQWFDGKIGIARIYNKALSSEETLQNFNANKSLYGL